MSKIANLLCFYSFEHQNSTVSSRFLFKYLLISSPRFYITIFKLLNNLFRARLSWLERRIHACVAINGPGVQDPIWTLTFYQCISPRSDQFAPLSLIDTYRLAEYEAKDRPPPPATATVGNISVLRRVRMQERSKHSVPGTEDPSRKFSLEGNSFKRNYALGH